MARKKETSKTKASKKKTGLSKLSQAHGKVEKVQPSSLDQSWGDTGISKYNTLDRGVYQTQIDNMNKSDLQTHATKVGLVPVDDSGVLRKRLLREFNKHVAAYRVPESSTKTVKLDDEAMKILGEGK